MPETFSTSAPPVVCGPPLHDLARQSLFFDFDGTLVDIAPTPDSIVVPDALIDALRVLSGRMPGRIAIVSGRSLAQLDMFLGSFASEIAIAGSHGAELRAPDAVARLRERPSGLDRAGSAFARFAQEHGLYFEHKTLGVAVHYRLKPALEAEAAALAEMLAGRYGLLLQRGKMMVELRVDGDKGRAVAALMALPHMAGTVPLVFGDDITDEDGFVTAEIAGGAGVLVDRPRETHARYRLPDVASVHAWIRTAIEATA